MIAIIPRVDANGLSVFHPSHPGEQILDRYMHIARVRVFVHA